MPSPIFLILRSTHGALLEGFGTNRAKRRVDLQGGKKR